MSNSLTLVQLKEPDQLVYLDQAYKIESALYEAQTWENKLIQEKQNNQYWLSTYENTINDRRNRIEQNESKILKDKDFIYSLSRELIEMFFGTLLVVGMFWTPIAFFVYVFLLDPDSSLRPFFSFGSMLILPIVGAILVIIYGIHDQKKEYSSYKKEIEEENKRFSEEIALYQQKITQNKQAISSYTSEIQLAHNEVKKLESIKKQFYSYHFLHPNYQGLICISQLLTYLRTGQCFTLYGVNGACRMYEQDLLQKKIIGKLDQVISLLGEIKETQYLLASAIEKANSTAMNNMVSMQKSLNQLQRESSLTNYYNQKIYEEEKFQSEMLMWNSFK